MTTKLIDKKHARNLFLICLVAGIFLIFWIVMGDSTNPNGKSLSISILKETIQSFRGVPRIDSAAKAVSAAETIFGSRNMNTVPSQVMDVKLLTYREAITRVNGMSLEGVGGVSADLAVWVVIFYTGRIDIPPIVPNPGSSPGECTYVFVDPQKGIVFQSGILYHCRW
jgi:hypothetical protein